MIKIVKIVTFCGLDIPEHKLKKSNIRLIVVGETPPLEIFGYFTETREGLSEL
jgi:hypothetical protein